MESSTQGGDEKFLAWPTREVKNLHLEDDKAPIAKSTGGEPLKEVNAPAKNTIPGQCCIPPPACDYQGLGTEETWGSLPVYLSGSPTSISAVLIIADIYGWQVPQMRRLADKIAAAGHLVVLPDFLENEFFVSSDPNIEYAGLPEFLERHPQPKVIEEAKKVLTKLESMGIKSFGVSGFCWGAKTTVGLLKGDTQVTAATMCHPSFVTLEEIKEHLKEKISKMNYAHEHWERGSIATAVKVPLAILAAEIDTITPPDLAEEFRIALAASPEVGSKSYVKLYKGAEHGWTTRYDLEDPEASKRANSAHEELISWYKKMLKPEEGGANLQEE